MAKTSIYLPDDLAAQARVYDIPVSEVAQAAVREAVRAEQVKESSMTDISAVAERLQATRIQAARAGSAVAASARENGIEWARQHATADELEYVATFALAADRYAVPTSLVFYEADARGRSNMFSPVPCRPTDSYWEEFQAGAREIWDAVKPLLDKMYESKSTR